MVYDKDNDYSHNHYKKVLKTWKDLLEIREAAFEALAVLGKTILTLDS